jgi:2,4-dienoyl-CoA reductase-like NADH-dependent reductase (Old Yellow Enzyme family)
MIMSSKQNAQESFKNLLSPIKIGPVELKNRMIMAPMNETLSNGHGLATEQAISYFGARAKGGAALVSTGAVMGTELASKFVWGRNLYCFNEGHLQGLNLLTDRIHYFGAKAAVQMTVGFGRQGHSYDHHLLVPAATGGLPYEMTSDRLCQGANMAMMSERARLFTKGQMTREMSIDEIRQQQKEYASSCQLAVCAGFDVIEIHACHGYLEHQFLSPVSNKRTDMYGGEWRNRKRFLNEVMEQIRYVCPGVAVTVRISAEEHFEGGLTREEMIDLAKDLEARGADAISLSDGGGYEEVSHLIADAACAEHFPDSAEDFKKALSIPVIIASQHDPFKANADIGDGKFDISALGRQLMIDPEYPNKIAEGHAEEIERCKRCNICTVRCLGGMSPGCPFNPWLGREYADSSLQIGPRQKHEHIFPPGMTNIPMPALDRPWWKAEETVTETYWRPFRGPGKYK